MKKFTGCILAIAVATATGTASANESQLVQGDRSMPTVLCMMAVNQPARFETEVDALGLDRRALRCNGRSVEAFVSKVTRVETPVVVKAGANTVATEVCVAAATSNEQYRALREKHFNARRAEVQQIVCNDMSLADFARQHGNPDFRI